MTAIEIHAERSVFSRIRSLCGFMGSFDPLHKGHEWIVEQLLQRFEVVLLLIPAIHFEKTVRFPMNATFDQRLEMLTSCTKGRKNRIMTGLTHEVLFLRLANRLKKIFPVAEITFGMGNETFERFLDSKAYYTQWGLPWSTEEQLSLDRLREKIIIFGRSGDLECGIAVPENIRYISSTRVRRTVMTLRTEGVPESQWEERLEGMISIEVLEFIIRKGIYLLS